ncbi:Cupin 2 conserved barrel domain protein [Methylocella silvestris BL2]|uniref:Cupin 2 conserved barrel domain protein n=1 Tax=Methylocella silvestris (strain DSM 15510 / CIP 108128 / LMG 27833 / NCIMB 13906 / BL2) TaxID=395965 RepID=B8ESE2_METSB|nr:cupin domain-containing protein [Methylocella silvestris]ACK49832.1 Cupin 2 conserved barrel domain protein [Methylocella silvestris BL2]
MFKTATSSNKGWRIAFLALCGAAAPVFAHAGECPTKSQVAGATAPVDYAAKGVTDSVIGAIDLSSEPAHIADRKLRLRKLVIEPGGVVPWHSHGDRPAIIYIVSGEVTEYASGCSVPIVHKTGDATPETHATSHWWKNTGRETAILLSADLLHDAADHNM